MFIAMVINEDDSTVTFSRNVKERYGALSICRRRRKSRYAYIAVICALSAVLVVAPLCAGRLLAHLNDINDIKDDMQERNLRSDTDDFDGSSVHESTHNIRHRPKPVNCTPRSIDDFPLQLFSLKQRQHGAVIIHVLVMAYMFAALGIVCDDYFMPALELTCEVLNLSEDVAGATFMAMGGSAPELFSSLIGVFIIQDDIGIGTIVGSAVFNILCVIGLCGILAGQVIELSCWPLHRDCFCYLLSIIALVLVVRDGVVYWQDAVCLLVMYLAYCILMYNNRTIEKFVHKVTPTCCTPPLDDEERKSKSESSISSNRRDKMELTRLMEDSEQESDSEVSSPSGMKPNGVYGGLVNQAKYLEKGVQVDHVPGSKTTNDDDNVDDGEKPSPFDLPEKGCGRVARLLAFPIIFVFYITIPDCRKNRWERCFVMTFLIALVWIGFLTYILVWMVTIIGDTLGIPDTIMGLTLLAAGASTPDTILSIIAAREGLGDMAISHSIGSNLFDILIGLGLPWFLQTVVIKRGSTVPIFSGAIEFIAISLLASVFVAFILISSCKFKLGKRLGVIFIVFYVIFVVISILFEMNIFIPGLTLPSCN